MSEHNSDARHPASQTRLQQAQRDGDFAKSQELSSAIQLFLGSIAIYFLVSAAIHQFTKFVKTIWNPAHLPNGSVESFNEQMSQVTGNVGFIMMPLLVVIFFVAVISNVAQNTTFTFFNKPVVDVNQLNPATGIKKLFSANTILRALLGIPKIAILIFVCGFTLWQQLDVIGNLAFQPISEMVAGMSQCVFIVLIACTSTLLVMSVGDYVIERFSFARRHRMTDQQLRDENRMQNTDPQVGMQRQQFYHDVFQDEKIL